MHSAAPLTSPCRVCKAEITTYLCETPNQHSKTQNLHHYRCDACGSVFVGDKIDNEELGVAYSIFDATTYYDEIESENRKKMASAVEDLKRLISENDSVIDIGTGNGLFVEFLHKAGFAHVSAHEIGGGPICQESKGLRATSTKISTTAQFLQVFSMQ